MKKKKDKAKRITLRDYLINHKTYNEDIDNTREEIIITEDGNDIILLSSPKGPKKKYTLKDLQAIGTFKGGKYLSRDIDKIVYGI